MNGAANGTGPQNPPRTAYLGPEASFSHQAVVEALPETLPVPLPSFKAILSTLQQSGSNPEDIYDYAILPVENSTNGSVVQALDLLAQCRLDPTSSIFPDIEVTDEHYLEVHHCLFVSRQWAQQKLSKEELDSLNTKPADRKTLEQLLHKLSIKTLYTHPQVWGQCNTFLSQFLPPGRVDKVDMSSTSAAAAYIASHHPFNTPQDSGEESGIAAISSSLAGAKHRDTLICLARNIEDDPGSNTTRFLILQNRSRHHHHNNATTTAASLQPPTTSPQIKSLFTFTIPDHTPGSLAKTLAIFANHGFNLSAIQSRPKPKTHQVTKIDVDKSHDRQRRNWKYVFFVECLHPTEDNAVSLRRGSGGDGLIDELVGELRMVTERLALVGSWPDRLRLEMS